MHSKSVCTCWQRLDELKAAGTVEELHVVDWFPKQPQPPLTNGYRRLDDYLQSTLRQQVLDDSSLSGIVQVTD